MAWRRTGFMFVLQALDLHIAERGVITSSALAETSSRDGCRPGSFTRSEKLEHLR